MNNRNLVITGFMGTGKSSVSRLIASRLQRELIDTDDLIETQFNKSIKRIFETEGEAKFRQLEAEVCEQLSQKNNLVIATGGGTLVPKKNLQILKKNASVFCLTANEQTLLERLSHSNKRPLFQAETLSDLIDDRCHAYARIFHQIKTDGLDKNHIADRVIELYRLDEKFLSSSLMVTSPSHIYPIYIQSEGLSSTGHILRWIQCRSKRLVVISNATVSSRHFIILEKSLKSAGFEVTLLNIPDGESYKTLATVEKLYHQLLSHHITRHDTLIALGGGVTGDITGFVAATYLRGISLIQIPTTLLSMVDSSVGGKTGVDLDEGKNLVGAFKQPNAVLIDPDLLNTLPQVEIKSGLAEVVKHAIIGDKNLFHKLEQLKVIDEEIIRQAVQVKVQIVQEDPFEENKRALLNLGHTFGHALEKVSRYKLRHGEAVSIGMAMASNLSPIPDLIKNLLTKLQLPITYSGHSAEIIYDAMKHDKKRIDHELRLIIPKAIGDVEITTASKEKIIKAIKDQILSS